MLWAWFLSVWLSHWFGREGHLSSPQLCHSLLRVLACMSVPLAAPLRNVSEMPPIPTLWTTFGLCSIAKDYSNITSEFSKALSSVLGVYTTFLDMSDDKAILHSYPSIELVVLASDEHLKSTTPYRTEILFSCLAFCYKEVFPFRPVGKYQLYSALCSITVRWVWEWLKEVYKLTEK